MPAPADFRLTTQAQVDWLLRQYPHSSSRYCLGYSNPNMRTEVYRELLALAGPKPKLVPWWTIDPVNLP